MKLLILTLAAFVGAAQSFAIENTRPAAIDPPEYQDCERDPSDPNPDPKKRRCLEDRSKEIKALRKLRAYTGDAILLTKLVRDEMKAYEKWVSEDNPEHRNDPNHSRLIAASALCFDVKELERSTENIFNYVVPSEGQPGFQNDPDHNYLPGDNTFNDLAMLSRDLAAVLKSESGFCGMSTAKDPSKLKEKIYEYLDLLDDRLESLKDYALTIHKAIDDGRH